MTARSCSVAGCARPHLARGLCRRHYQRLYRNGAVDLPPRPIGLCSVPDCIDAAVARGFCTVHYGR